VILIILLAASFSFRPQYYTNTNYIHDITGLGPYLYGATNGGVLRYETANDGFLILTSTDGLRVNRQRCIAIDSSQYIWTGSDFGLSVVDDELVAVSVYPSEYLTSIAIQDIVCLQDSVYVGSSSGLLFIETHGTSDVFEDDERLRIFDITPNSNDVRSIAVDDTSVWLGTANGLAVFSKDFMSSTQYSTDQGLLSNAVNTVSIIDSEIYVATDQGLNQYVPGGFDTLVIGRNVHDVAHLGDSLVLALDSIDQVGIYYQGTLTVISDSLPYRCAVRALYNINGTLYCGLGNRYVRDYYGEGIGQYSTQAGFWNIIKRTCIPSNHISDITANQHGVFVACGARSSDSRGLGWMRTTGEWVHISRDSLLTSNEVHRCVTAPDGRVWLGINAFSSSGSDTAMVYTFDAVNDVWTLLPAGYLGIDQTVAVWDLCFDGDNNLYLSLAGPSDKLWLFDSSLTTAMFLGDRSPGFVVQVVVDSAGRVWQTMTGADGGLILIDTRNTLFDRSDDYYTKYGVSDGLASKYAWGAVVDPMGNLFVANETQLLEYDGDVFSTISGFTGDMLFDLVVDSEGRIWVMGREGLYYYDPVLDVSDAWRYDDIGVYIEFLEISNEVIQIQGFEFDGARNCFWIGGETGLLQLEVFIDTVTQLDSIVIYPNPVLAKDVVKIKNIPADSRVNIYSLSGRLVAENLTVDEVFGEVVWRIPADIGSGLYYALIQTNNGNRVRKFAVVR
jgi:hypothetical protein